MSPLPRLFPGPGIFLSKKTLGNFEEDSSECRTAPQPARRSGHPSGSMESNAANHATVSAGLAERCTAGFAVSLRLKAELISAICDSAWGKLPRRRRAL